jgi:hypothetical protein
VDSVPKRNALKCASLSATLNESLREMQTKKDRLLRLGGGINNDVYRVEKRGLSYVLKLYPTLPSETRNRIKAEVEFLKFANSVASDYVPRLIDYDFDKRAVLLEFIEGTTFIEGCSPSAKQIRDAVRFFETLNQSREAAESLVSMDAAEGYLRLTDHLASIDERISKLATNHLPEALSYQSSSLIDRLKEEYHSVKENSLAIINQGDVPDEIKPEDRCVSPSDFGFHNAIQTSHGVKFIDFEFAGWDDPAKATVDFILQPRVQVRAKHTVLLDVLSVRRKDNESKRTMLLGSILRIKWLCIILAVLDPERYRKLVKSMDLDKANQLMEKQLLIATKYFDREVPFGLS